MSWRDDIPCLYGPPIDRSPYKPEPFVPPEPIYPKLPDIKPFSREVDTVFFEMIMKLSEKIAFTEEIMNIINEARTKLSK